MAGEELQNYGLDWKAGLAGVSRDPLIDGRQSDRALGIQRGTCRHLIQLGWAPLTEFSLANGRRADITALGKSGDIWIIEIKSSLADFRTDGKWPEYLEYCDQLLFAVASNFPLDVLPDEAGIIVADRYGAEIQRAGEENRLPAARRKAVTSRFSRSAALRLRSILDPISGN